MKLCGLCGGIKNGDRTLGEIQCLCVSIELPAPERSEFLVNGERTHKTLMELCDEIETLANEMRQQRHIGNAGTIMHLAADAAVTYGRTTGSKKTR